MFTVAPAWGGNRVAAATGTGYGSPVNPGFHLRLPILAGLAILHLVMFVMVMSRHRRKAKLDFPTCGACGYAVRGVSTFNCPECGVDLRESGIKTPTDERSSSARLFLAAYLAVFLLLTLAFLSLGE